MTAPARSRRADILAAAEREFAAAGFSGGRIERIAASAGVNKQLLFHYFGSKEGLFLSALSTMLARHDPLPTPPSDHPTVEIREVINSLQNTVRDIPGILAILADAAANPDFPADSAQLITAWRRRLSDRLRTAIEVAQRSGYFRDDIDAQALAGVSLAAALGSGALDRSSDLLPVAHVMTDYSAWR